MWENAIEIVSDFINQCDGAVEELRLTRMCDVDSKGHVQTLSGHSGGVNALSLSRDGRTLFSGSDDNTIRIWNLDSNECVQTLSGHSILVLALILLC